MLALLGEHEFHSLLSNASKRLLGIHQAMDNFYNEPPFAERLLQLTQQGAIPDTAKEELVAVVVTCATGSRYGVSNAAIPHYHSIIQGFSPNEVEIMLALPAQKLIVSERLKSHGSCRVRYKELVGLIDPSSVPTKSASAYAHWNK